MRTLQRNEYLLDGEIPSLSFHKVYFNPNILLYCTIYKVHKIRIFFKYLCLNLVAKLSYPGQNWLSVYLCSRLVLPTPELPA